MKIKNNGTPAYNVRIEVFRDENSKPSTKLRLLSHKVADQLKPGQECTVHKNLPIFVKTKELEVVLHWELAEDQNLKAKSGEKINGRTWTQSFAFKPADQ